MDSVDADFGASSPVYLAQPSPMVAAVSKDGHLVPDRRAQLRRHGRRSWPTLTLATGGAMIIHTTPAAYATAQGMHVVLTVNTGAQCTGTGANGKAVMSVLIPAGTPPVPKRRLVHAGRQRRARLPGVADGDHHRRHVERDRLVHERHAS